MPISTTGVARLSATTVATTSSTVPSSLRVSAGFGTVAGDMTVLATFVAFGSRRSALSTVAHATTATTTTGRSLVGTVARDVPILAAAVAGPFLLGGGAVTACNDVVRLGMAS